MRLRTFLGTIVLAALIFCCGTVQAQDITARLSRSLTEAPSLDVLGSERGFVILREIDYRLLADGRMERTTLWFIHEGGGLPETWRNWEIISPEGGDATVLESALYDPNTKRIQYPLIPVEAEKDGVRMIEVRLPNSFEGNILALSYRQVFPTSMNIEDALPVDLDLAQWEQRFTLTVPSGTIPEWAGEGIPDPQVNAGGAEDTYSWSIINTPVGDRGTLSPTSGRWLFFSLKKGLRYALADAAALAGSVNNPPPARVVSLISDSNKTRGGERIMEYVNDPVRLDRTLPRDLVRNSLDIPSDGPWTEWEASFLLVSWLKRAGWAADVIWEPLLPVGDDSPATLKIWNKPVLSVTPPAGKSYMFEIGQAVRPGSMPPRLWGRTVHSLEGSNPSRQIIPAGGAADHRLSFNWKLELSPGGLATGELVITVRGAWSETLTAGSVPASTLAEGILSSFVWPSLPGFSSYDPVLAPFGSGFRITVPVSTQIGIPGGEGLLVRMPSVIMPWQNSIAERGVPSGIRYPFVYEQSIEIDLPEGFEVMVLPALRPYDAGSVRLEESLRVRKNQTLSGEQKIVVSSTRLDDQMKQAVANAVRQGLGWSGATIPLRKR